MIGQTVIVHRYRTDRVGDRQEISTHLIPHCGFSPRTIAGLRGTSEDTDRAQRVSSGAELYAPAGADVTPADVIELADGTAWEVSGAPERWHSPFSGGWTPGVVVPLERLTG